MDILIGLLAAAVGALFCFRGVLAARVVIGVWGAFVGFMFGAGLVALVSNGGFLGDVVGWLVGAAFAALFGWLAYAYYKLSIALTMASAGFVLATSILITLGVTANWLLWLAGIGLGIALAVLSYRAELAALALMIVTAFSGASVIIFGLMLIFNAISLDAFTTDQTPTITDGAGLWSVLYIVLAIAGIAAQATLRGGVGGKVSDDYAATA